MSQEGTWPIAEPAASPTKRWVNSWETVPVTVGSKPWTNNTRSLLNAMPWVCNPSLTVWERKGRAEDICR